MTRFYGRASRELGRQFFSERTGINETHSRQPSTIFAFSIPEYVQLTRIKQRRSIQAGDWKTHAPDHPTNQEFHELLKKPSSFGNLHIGIGDRFATALSMAN
jgi:hypothetical protein